MRNGFQQINLYPLVFSPDHSPAGSALVGHAFTIEGIEHRGEETPALVVKTTEPAIAFDPLRGKLVHVPPAFAVRVPLTPALRRMIALVVNPANGAPSDAVPCVCIEIVIGADGSKLVAIGHAPALAIARATFTPPAVIPEGTQLAVAEPVTPPTPPAAAPAAAPTPASAPTPAAAPTPIDAATAAASAAAALPQ